MALAVFLAGAVLSLNASRITLNGEKADVSIEVTHRTSLDIAAIRRALETEITVLHSLKSLFVVSGNVDRQTFSDFAKGVQNNRGYFKAIEWIPRVSKDDRILFEQRAREDGLTDFTFTEREHQGTMLRRSEQEEYFPVYYVEPIQGNEAAVGFDLASNETHRAALEYSRETGESVATARITIVQEQESQYAIWFFVPVFDDSLSDFRSDNQDERFRGYILGVVRIEDLVESSLEPTDLEDAYIVLRDTSSPANESVLYSNFPIDEENELEISARLTYANFFEFGGRHWSMEHAFSDAYINDRLGQSHWFVLVFGILLSFLFSGYTSVILGREKSTRQLVKLRTAELSASEARYKDLFDRTGDLIQSMTPEGNIIFVNDAWVNTIGYTESEIQGKSIYSLVHQDDRAHCVDYFGKILAGENLGSIILRFVAEDGREVLLKGVTTCHVEQGKPDAMRSIFYDITERTRAEHAIKEAHAEIAESLKRVEHFNLQLQEMNRHKSKFLSSMSHELRTPLNAILGFGDLLGGQGFGALNEKQARYVEQIDTSAEHLLDLINDLLDMAKIDSGAMTLNMEECAPRECIEGVVIMLGAQFRKAGLEVDTHIDSSLTVIDGDSRKIKQIMLNLLSNAIKYTLNGGSVIVRAEKLSADTVRVTVQDTGIGVKAEQREAIFSEFHQADQARDEALGGIGLGLALTRRLVELHGGEIGVESEQGEGSTFWFTLPLLSRTQDTGIEEHQSESISEILEGLRILVAEDDQENLDMILDMLTLKKCEVTVARNGEEAIHSARSFRPDIILMDIRMPVMNGIEATKKIRTISGFEETPIIALTASAGSNSEEQCLEAGCTLHLSKPVKSGRLYAAIREVCGTSSM